MGPQGSRSLSRPPAWRLKLPKATTKMSSAIGAHESPLPIVRPTHVITLALVGSEWDEARAGDAVAERASPKNRELFARRQMAQAMDLISDSDSETDDEEEKEREEERALKGQGATIDVLAALLDGGGGGEKGEAAKEGEEEEEADPFADLEALIG